VFSLESWDNSNVTAKPVLLAGCRNGSISLWDLRSNRKAGEFYCLGSVCHMKKIRDCYLISSAMNHQLAMWDLRMIQSNGGREGKPEYGFRKPKPVLTYEGHNNEYRLIQFALDDSENFLVSGTFLDFASGHLYSLLHTISLLCRRPR
jgi:WD40 repeat protein